MGDLANTTNQQLENINNTAVSQIKAINSSAAAAGESQTKGINTVASSQISNITNVTNQQLMNINNAATGQIENIERKTSIQIDAINNTATRQIGAINSTALSQIGAINNTTTNQIENMTVKYSDMCRTLGIEHEGILCIFNLKEVSINVTNFKYIKFGKMYLEGKSNDKQTLVSNKGPYLFRIKTDQKNDNYGISVTTNKEYDISLEKEMNCYPVYQYNTGYHLYIEYKLYNDEDGINGVTDLIVENALGGDY